MSSPGVTVRMQAVLSVFSTPDDEMCGFGGSPG